GRATTRSPPPRSRTCWPRPRAARSKPRASVCEKAGPAGPAFFRPATGLPIKWASARVARTNNGSSGMKRIVLGALCALAVAGCTDPEAERQAQAAAEAQARQQREAKAEEVAARYDEAVAAQDWDRARIHGAAIFDQYAGSDVAARI